MILAIDGRYFRFVENHYLFEHSVGSRLSISGIEHFAQTRLVSTSSVSSHLFEGRTANAQDTLAAKYWERDRRFEAAGVTVHCRCNARMGREKGVDTELTAFTISDALTHQHKEVALIAGDADYIPLIETLKDHGVRVLLLGWNLSNSVAETRTSVGLIDSASDTVQMNLEIEQGLRSRRRDVLDLFESPYSRPICRRTAA